MTGRPPETGKNEGDGAGSQNDPGQPALPPRDLLHRGDGIDLNGDLPDDGDRIAFSLKIDRAV